MTRPDILNSIPHRAPFLFIDEVIELDERRIVTRKLADPKADFFKGHYPGNPVMPGVLLCECCFQAGALLIGQRFPPRATAVSAVPTTTGTPVITRIQDAKFKRIVRPGDVLHIEVIFDDEINDVFFMIGRVTVDGELALRVGFAATMIHAVVLGHST